MKYQILNVNKSNQNKKFEIGNWKFDIRNLNKGFTLIELLLYLGIFSILLIALTEIFVSTIDTKIESETTANVEQDSKFIISRLSYDLNRTQNIVLPGNLGLNTDTLTITVNSINHTYRLSSGNLELNDGIESNQLNGYNTTISNLNFQRLGNLNGKNTIRINFTITSKTIKKSGAETRDFQTTIGLK